MTETETAGDPPPRPLTDAARREAVEAAVFRRLVQHLRERTDVQNIDLMNLAGFCRNCLSRWYVEEAAHMGETVDGEAARTEVYGMRYTEWKARFQTEASADQKAAFEKAAGSDHG